MNCVHTQFGLSRAHTHVKGYVSVLRESRRDWTSRLIVPSWAHARAPAPEALNPAATPLREGDGHRGRAQPVRLPGLLRALDRGEVAAPLLAPRVLAAGGAVILKLSSVLR